MLYGHLISLLACFIMTKNSTLKRKKVCLSIEDKLDICEMGRKKVPIIEIMAKYNIGKSTAYDIIKQEEQLKGFKRNRAELGIGKSVKSAKSMKCGMFEKLDGALYL